jgi:hypothetical protein
MTASHHTERADVPEEADPLGSRLVVVSGVAAAVTGHLISHGLHLEAGVGVNPVQVLVGRSAGAAGEPEVAGGPPSTACLGWVCGPGQVVLGSFGPGPGVSVTMAAVSVCARGIAVRLEGGERAEVTTCFTGPHLPAAATAAFLTLRSLGMGAREAVETIARCPRPDGYFEVLADGRPYTVVRDTFHPSWARQDLVDAAQSLAGSRARVIVLDEHQPGDARATALEGANPGDVVIMPWGGG